MRAKLTAVTVAGALVVGGGVGYVAGGAGSDSAARVMREHMER